MPKRAFSITGLLKLLVVAVLAVCMLAAAAGCGAPRLSTPSGLNINELDLTLNWNDVSGAAYYTVRIRGNDVDDEVLASNNSYSLERYAPGGYTVSVRAEAGANAGNSSSRWSQAIEFERPYENGLTMELTDSNTAFEVTGIGTASGDIVIPDTYRGLPVTSVAERAFINNTSVTAVTVGANVKEIGDYAFANCAQLTVDLSTATAVTSIGMGAFSGCTGITEFAPGEGEGSQLERIGAFAFANSSLRSVDLSNTKVTDIDAGAFSGCVWLASFKFSAEIENIGVNAFDGCAVLADNGIHIPEGTAIAYIGDFAFRGTDVTADKFVGHLATVTNDEGVQVPVDISGAFQDTLI